MTKTIRLRRREVLAAIAAAIGGTTVGVLAGGLERPGLQPQLQEEHGFRVVRRGNVSLRGTGSPGETYAASFGGKPAVQVRVQPPRTWQADVPVSPAAFRPSTIALDRCGLLRCR